MSDSEDFGFISRDFYHFVSWKLDTSLELCPCPITLLIQLPAYMTLLEQCCGAESYSLGPALSFRNPGTEFGYGSLLQLVKVQFKTFVKGYTK